MDKIWTKHYVEGIPAEVDVNAYGSLVEALEKNCKKYKDQVAFTSFGASINYEEFDQKSRALATLPIFY